MNVYEEIGLQKVINASGKMSILGVSTLSKETINAIKEGSESFVVIDKLMKRAGEIISNYTGAEASCVTASASAGIAIAVASLITKNIITNIENIHTLETKKREVIIQKGHVVNYGAPIKTMIELGAGKLIEVGQSNLTSKENIIESINENTVALFYVKSHHSVQKGMVSLEDIIEIGKKYNIPVVVDAAAEEELKKYVSLGSDLVIYSGAKAIEAPSSGFITGKKELVENCYLQYKGIGRAMKVDKGIIMGLLSALEQYSNRDEKKIAKENKEKSEKLSSMLGKISDTESMVVKDDAGREIYRVELKLNSDKIKIDTFIDKLENGNPAIYTRNYYKNQNKIHFDTRAVSNDDIELIVEKMQKILG